MPKYIFTTILGAALLIFISCGNEQSRERPGAAAAPALKEVLPSPVEVVAVRRGDIHRPISTTGYANAWLESHVGAKISGRVQNIFVREGDQVEKGAILFQLDQTDYLLSRKAAQAQLAVAQASHREARIYLDTISREKERFNKLFEKNAISQQKNDEINSSYSMAATKLELAAANVLAAESNLSLAEARLNDTVIRSPFSGVVFRKNANEAEMISAGTPVISLMNIDRLKLEAEVPEIQASQIKKGMPVEIKVDALPGKTFSGRISVINPRVNPQSRNFKIEIHMENPGHLIKPGMFCRVSIQTETVKNTLVIPLKALLTETDAAYVLVAKDNRAVKRRVVTGITTDWLAEIKSGLEEGENVLITGNYGMEEGTPLTPRLVSY